MPSFSHQLNRPVHASDDQRRIGEYHACAMSVRRAQRARTDRQTSQVEAPDCVLEAMFAASLRASTQADIAARTHVHHVDADRGEEDQDAQLSSDDASQFGPMA